MNNENNKKASHKIYDYLLNIILENKYITNYKLPSENVLAKKFETSKMSAQLALKKLAEEKYVIKKRGSGSYINTEYVLGIDNFNNTSDAKIALIFPLSQSKFLNLTYNAVYSHVKKLGFYPVCYFTESVDDENDILKLLINKKYDGIILYPHSDGKLPSELLVDLVNNQFPIVLIDRYYRNLDSYTISSNHFASSYKIVEYFYKNNCKRICFITEFPYCTTLKHRHSGFETALLHFPELLPKSGTLVYDVDNAEKFDKELYNAMVNKEFDSIITYSGEIANHVISNAKKSKMKIGKDFLLALYDEEVSFDNVIDFSYVKLRQDTTEIGNTSAQILYKLLSKETPTKKRYDIPTTLIDVNKKKN